LIAWITIHGAVFFVIVLGIIVVTALISGRKSLVKCVSIGFKELTIICLIILASWAVRQFLITKMHNVYLDEFVHMQLARTILDTGKFGITSVAGDPEAPVVRAVKWPPAFHTLLAAAYMIGGRQETTAYALNAILGALGVLGAYLFAKMLCFSVSTCLSVAILISLWPLHLRMCAGASTEPGAMAMILIASSLMIAFLKTRNKSLFWAGAAAIGLAGMFRLESVLAAAIVPSVLAVWEERRSGRPVRLSVSQYIGFCIFCTPIFLFAISGFTEYRAFRAQSNTIPYWGGLSFWYGGGLMPYSYSAMLLLGLIVLWKRRLPLFAACFLAIIGMLFIYAFYIHIDASRGDLQRYQLQCAPGFIGFAAAAFQWAEDSRKKFRFNHAIIILLLFVGLIPSLPEAQKPFRADFEQKYRFVTSSSSILPKDAMYFAAIPSFLSTTLGIQCSPLQRLLKKGGISKLAQGRTKIYFRNIWSPELAAIDRQISRRYILRPLVERHDVPDYMEFLKIEDRPFANR